MSGMRPGFRLAAVLTTVFIVWMAAGVVMSPRVDPLSNPPPGVVISLTSSVDSDSSLDDAGTKRLTKAIDVATHIRADLVTTRGFRHGHVTDGGQRRLIKQAGWLSHWTILSGLPRSTRDEALMLRAVTPDSVRIAVVTSPLHTRRALRDL